MYEVCIIFLYHYFFFIKNKYTLQSGTIYFFEIMNIKIEHIDNLISGKKSWNKIGSRSVPHHLYSYEKIKYESALKNKFLEITQKDRINLINVWDKVCLAKWWPNIILMKNRETWMADILKDWFPIKKWVTKDMKHLIKTYV